MTNSKRVSILTLAMTPDELKHHIEEIVSCLSELLEKDKAIIKPESYEPITISVEQLAAYGKRYEERQRLHAKLRSLTPLAAEK